MKMIVEMEESRAVIYGELIIDRTFFGTSARHGTLKIDLLNSRPE